MSRDKNKSELAAEVRFLRKGQRVEFWTATFTQFIKWAGLVAIAYIGYLGIATLAGRSTSANIIVNFLGDVRVSQTLSWVLTAGGVSYGAAQGKLRKQTERRMGERIKELEGIIDPKRSSSG
jgi:hypothetical protein